VIEMKKSLFIINVFAAIVCESVNKDHVIIGESERIPLHFFRYTDLAVVNMVFEGKSYAMRIDTGSNKCFSLNESALQAIQKKEHLGTAKFFDGKGKEYEVPRFLVSRAMLGAWELENSIVDQADIDYLTKGSKLWEDKTITNRTKKQLKYLDGRIGLKGLDIFNCFFDYPNAVLYISKNLQELKKHPSCSLEDFNVFSFELTGQGIIFLIDTDFGMKRFLLDSGCSFTLIKKFAIEKRAIRTWRLKIGGRDYGAWNLMPYKITDRLKDVDGILGVDFFRQYAIDIDFENQVAYVEPPHGFMLRVWRDMCNWWYCL
jgi:hypothetical protein